MARRGRPSVFGVAMTSTERNRRRIDRLKGAESILAGEKAGITIDGFIAANPEIQWHTRRRIGGRAGAVGTNSGGETVWVIILGNHHVSSTEPLTRENIRAAVQNLEDIQPGTEFATVYDDRLAARLRASHVPLGNWVTPKQGAPA